jgi:hypothetical protein
MSEPITFRLNNGRDVLAKISDGEPYPVTYANRTQALRKTAEMGPGWVVIDPGRPFYVARGKPADDQDLANHFYAYVRFMGPQIGGAK